MPKTAIFAYPQIGGDEETLCGSPSGGSPLADALGEQEKKLLWDQMEFKRPDFRRKTPSGPML